jgi:hypothetical protein
MPSSSDKALRISAWPRVIGAHDLFWWNTAPSIL